MMLQLMTTAVQTAPHLTLDAAAAIAAELYSLEGAVSALPSERDQNFLLVTAGGEKFVLKIANAAEDVEFLELQNRLIRFLAAANIDLDFPRIIPAANGKDIPRIVSAESRNYFVRLFTWLEGTCF